MSKIAGANSRLFEDARSWPAFGDASLSGYQPSRVYLWNPTNFAIVVLLLAAPAKVSVLSHQWGNDLATNLVIWTFGL
jgi:hypothetical protein